MRAVDIIRKKRDDQTLTAAEIEAFIQGATLGHWEKYQVSAMLMAIFFRGLSPAETTALTTAMIASGSRLDWSDLPGPKLDKHSTGGVGDKTSLILAPLVVACGGKVPMMSGRGLGHTGGTLDKLEAIPGFRVGLSLAEFRQAMEKVGCGLIGQTAEVAPADKLLYALRDVTATVESIPLIAASIMSKKIAEGVDALVIDVKVGQGAFMKNYNDAEELAETLVGIGHDEGVRTLAFITDMEQPLGTALGNSLEIIESLEVLKGRGPEDVATLSVKLAAAMLWLGGLAKDQAEADDKIRQALSSGRGLDVFRQILRQQGGSEEIVDDYGKLPTAPHRRTLTADRAGGVTAVHAEKLGLGSMILGAGRERMEDKVDHAVGVLLHVKRGAKVEAGQPLLEIHYRDEARLARALPLLEQAIEIGPHPPLARPLIHAVIEESRRGKRDTLAMGSRVSMVD
ncbi:MAG TPA: thymidine phosphorylase [Gemmatales bacterium]|nr:thymidine phosphorylase [Gemmatales bacterium]HMP60617.1 thymidine phosphorylase [Gemmatales bacterium]